MSIAGIYSSGGNAFSRAINFIDGNYAQGIGAEWRDARKNGRNFSAKDAYSRYWGKTNIDNLQDTVLKNARTNYTNFDNMSLDNKQKILEREYKCAIKEKFGDPKIKGKAERTRIKLLNKPTKKHLKQTIKQMAQNAGKKPGFFARLASKIPGGKFVGKLLKGGLKRLGPIAILASTGYSIYNELQAGNGFLGTLKAIGRGLLDQGGYILGATIAGALFGATGPVGLIAGIALGMGGAYGANWLGSKIMPLASDAPADQQLALQQQAMAQQQMLNAGGNPYTNINVQNDPNLKAFNDMLADRTKTEQQFVNYGQHNFHAMG